MMISKLQLRASVFSILVLVSALAEDLLSCDTTSPATSGFACDKSVSGQQCRTFALLRTNSYYSSLFNLSSYLGINRFVLAEANGFSADTEFLPGNQPLLLPLDCRCIGGFFEAELRKTTVKGESFYGIAQSLEGLTTCKAIRDKNPGVSPWGLEEKIQLAVPLRCACPSSADQNHQRKFLLSYPVSEGDTLSKLASHFNTTPENIISANDRGRPGFRLAETLIPISTLLIPLEAVKPVVGSTVKPQEPSLRNPSTSPPRPHRRKKKSKMWKIGLYISLCVIAFGVSLAVAAAYLVTQWKRKRHEYPCEKAEDVELQQLNLSVRTISEKKVSFEGSQDALDGELFDATPHKMLMETYSVEELRKATEDFNSTNLIEDSVFHGRLSGKDLAIKRTQREVMSKIELGLFYDAIHHHPNIIRLLGSCVTEGPDSFLVLEYAKNGSLKDWLHGGLAMKSPFIASCYCFLTWNQRLRICLDVATALQYMHHIMNPAYVHRNIKSRNIFLDEEFNAKVGNFGMARCVEDDIPEEKRQKKYGSNWDAGYLSPEYLDRGGLISPTPSIDVFAYGVILLEVLSGRTPIHEEGGDSVKLSEKIKSILQSENADEMRAWIDGALGENYSFDAAVTVANLARACVEDDPSARPSAAEIVDKLSKLVQESPEGQPLSFCESSCKPLVKAAATSN